MRKTLNAVVLAAASLVGVAAFLYPFFFPQPSETAQGMLSHSNDAPFLFIILMVFCLGMVLSNLSSGQMNSKIIAVLGILTAVNAVLRAVPGPAGFAAVFFLPILVGYSYGATFGFLLGALSILVSALLGAGVGPWLPFQMFATGWIGMASAWLPDMQRRPRLEVAVLTVWGFGWGFAFGAAMNLWFWPFVFDPTQTALYWQPGIGAIETLKRYAAFYVVTSLWWDLGRAVGNGLLLLLFGGPILRLLRRFRVRFQFEIQPV
ncbi:MAG: ECF transporter S component [Anaerolineae bacterium]|jgi:energy-coupling factor transport system substrate-specific component|nr:ECF transporter S component [Anaerolineae bacterium]MDH7475074.1 ECF transporter S component [Anaerolineae bacterium]